MAFFFETIAIPFWFIVFIFGSASPLWFKWYKKLHLKFISGGKLFKKFKRVKSDADIKDDTLKKSNDNWNENSVLSGFSESKEKKRKPIKKSIDPVKKRNIQSVLQALADGGEAGVLPRTISDKTEISTIETKNALNYLIEKNYAEEVNSTNGTKYYLTGLGRKYCINKKYIES